MQENLNQFSDSARLENASLFENVFENLNLPAIVADRQGTIKNTNRAFVEMLASPEANHLENNIFFDHFADSEQQKISDLLQSLSKPGQSETIQTKIILPNKKRKKVEIYFSSMQVVPDILITFCELPEEVWSQKEIKHKTAELENLFYLMSHNMKSPIVSIQGFTNLLLENPLELPEEERLHYLERIKSNATRLNMMVQDLLEFSKLSKKNQKYVEVPLSEVFSNIYTEAYFKIKKKGIKIKIDEELPTIVADYEEMETVFQNLFDNAIKYIGDSKHPEIELGWKDKGRFYVFWIKDNGMGIPAKFHDRIFNPFERANASNQIEGTGVGLAIVKRIVQKHGGLMKVNSRVGLGTTFYFTIPKFSQI